MPRKLSVDSGADAREEHGLCRVSPGLSSRSLTVDFRHRIEREVVSTPIAGTVIKRSLRADAKIVDDVEPLNQIHPPLGKGMIVVIQSIKKRDPVLGQRLSHEFVEGLVQRVPEMLYVVTAHGLSVPLKANSDAVSPFLSRRHANPLVVKEIHVMKLRAGCFGSGMFGEAQPKDGVPILRARRLLWDCALPTEIRS